MITRNHIALAAKFYQAHDSMNALYGHEFKTKIQDYINLIKATMKARSMSELEACQHLVKKSFEVSPYNSGMTVALLLAAVVEMFENVSETVCGGRS